VIDFSTNRWRVFSAWCCLFAAVLLFAPMAQAAWSARAAACCTDHHCPIPQHHHSKSPEHAADCEHAVAGMTPCSISCCEKTDRTPFTPVAFVLARAALPAISLQQIAAISIGQAKRLLSFFEVLSPPPRS
jgi:hypothetical protein